ncbi:unnamed protein product [Lampetra fluviatilis]
MENEKGRTTTTTTPLSQRLECEVGATHTHRAEVVNHHVTTCSRDDVDKGRRSARYAAQQTSQGCEPAPIKAGVAHVAVL